MPANALSAGRGLPARRPRGKGRCAARREVRTRMNLRHASIAVAAAGLLAVSAAGWQARAGSAPGRRAAQPAPAAHPLDPLTPDEIARATTIREADLRFPPGSML